MRDCLPPSPGPFPHKRGRGANCARTRYLGQRNAAFTGLDSSNWAQIRHLPGNINQALHVVMVARASQGSRLQNDCVSWLALDGAEGQAADDEALDHQRQDDGHSDGDERKRPLPRQSELGKGGLTTEGTEGTENNYNCSVAAASTIIGTLLDARYGQSTRRSSSRGKNLQE